MPVMHARPLPCALWAVVPYIMAMSVQVSDLCLTRYSPDLFKILVDCPFTAILTPSFKLKLRYSQTRRYLGCACAPRVLAKVRVGVRAPLYLGHACTTLPRSYAVVMKSGPGGPLFPTLLTWVRVLPSISIRLELVIVSDAGSPPHSSRQSHNMLPITIAVQPALSPNPSIAAFSWSNNYNFPTLTLSVATTSGIKPEEDSSIRTISATNSNPKPGSKQ